ncbi:MAG TPA: glycerol kinase GlpK [Acidimicrobiales bacterium]|nr:glycerol kinase GlpK [Acidimicrobiales bacterium]
MDHVLALDAGTSGVRAISLAPSGQVVDVAYRELSQHYPRPGWVEHDAAEIASLAEAVLDEVARAVRERGDVVVALGITNQRETVVALDRESPTPLHRALVWQDRRGKERCEALIAAGAQDRVRAVTGLVIDPYFSATKMAWLIEHGVLDSATSPGLATIDSWLVWWLSGHVNGGAWSAEPSNASRTLVMDLATRQWSQEMAELFGVDVALLAPIEASNSPRALVSGDVVASLAGVPISGVLGDQQAALFGQSCFSPGMVKATYGTGAFVLANAGASVPPIAQGLLTTVAWDDGEVVYAYEGSSFVAGAAVQWLRDEMGVIEHSSDLESLATSVPDSAGVVVVPAFAGLGSPFWRADARGSITGLSRGAGSAHIARALVEALAYQVRAITDAFATHGLGLSELRADGGAAAMDLLLQLQATNSRVTVRRSANLEATAHGAAALAGEAVGLWRREDLASAWSSQADFTPEDPLFADLGYEAWLHAAERA